MIFDCQKISKNYYCFLKHLIIGQNKNDTNKNYIYIYKVELCFKCKILYKYFTVCFKMYRIVQISTKIWTFAKYKIDIVDLNRITKLSY